MNLQHIDVQKIMTQELSRKDFLVSVAATAVAVVGIGSLLKNINDIFGRSASRPATSRATGYGGSAYSGLQPK